MKEVGVDLSNQLMFIAHSNRAQQALRLAELVKENFNPKEIIITDVGMACGSSIGPGLCAVYFVGEPISENCEKEKAIMKALDEQIKGKNNKGV